MAETPPGRLLNRPRCFLLRGVVIILSFHVPAPTPIPPRSALWPSRQRDRSLPELAACQQINYQETLPRANSEPNTIAPSQGGGKRRNEIGMNAQLAQDQLFTSPVLWAVADQGDAQVEVPVIRDRVTLVQVDGSNTEHRLSGHALTVNLKGDRKMAPPVLVVDRPESESRGETR